jgi:hypothetical protein
MYVRHLQQGDYPLDGDVNKTANLLFSVSFGGLIAGPLWITRSRAFDVPIVTSKKRTAGVSLNRSYGINSNMRNGSFKFITIIFTEQMNGFLVTTATL